MPAVELDGINNHICRDLSLSIHDGELLVLLGPTGAGKTTLLNVIAGLAAYRGRVLFDGHPVDAVPTRQRQAGYVPQTYCLFPHLTAAENIGFGLRAQGYKKELCEARVQELLALFCIESLADRYPLKGLSGGEQQRIALARALAPWPRVLLLDEPLNSLDLRTAKYLRLELRRLQQQLKITTVYVTHNQQDASEIGDRVALLNKGKLEQVGPYRKLFFSPHNQVVASFFGSHNIFFCRSCIPKASGLAEVELDGLSLVVPYEGRLIESIAISPWNIFLSAVPVPGPQVNRLKGCVLQIEVKSAFAWIVVQCFRERFVVALQKELWDESGLCKGDSAYLVLPLRWIYICAARKDPNEMRKH